MTGPDNFGIIEHEGIVRKSDDKSVTVKISSETACSGCHAEGFCAMFGNEEKLIDIKGSYNVSSGDRVTVLMKKSMGFTAVFLGYILPLILVIISLVILVASSLPELISGIGSIGVLIFYYIILYFFRNRINNKFTFTLKV